MRLSNIILTISLLASLQGIAQTEDNNDITIALQIHNYSAMVEGEKAQEAPQTLLMQLQMKIVKT